MSENTLTAGRMSKTGAWLHYFANPGRFLRFVRPALPWAAAVSMALTVAGLVWGYVFAPADWEQGDAARIMYVHVPAAWVAMSGYAMLAGVSFFSVVWRHPLADLAASVLVLFFLYLGHIALIRAFDNPAHGYRAAAILALVGAINLPIIVFSVQWWNTLHQGNTISVSGGAKIYITMLYPLLVATLGFYLSFLTLVCARMCAAIMERRTRTLLVAAAERGA